MALFTRWYVAPVVVGLVMGGVTVLAGALLAWLGDAFQVCSGDAGCLWMFGAGVFIAPYEAVCAMIASALVSRRLAPIGAVSLAQRWRSCFGAGVLALFPAGFLTMATLHVWAR
ncbi:MAG: hypothetical protein ACOY0T_39795 [Myxococcota bacterium]